MCIKVHFCPCFYITLSYYFLGVFLCLFHPTINKNLFFQREVVFIMASKAELNISDEATVDDFWSDADDEAMANLDVYIIDQEGKLEVRYSGMEPWSKAKFNSLTSFP